MSHPAWQEDEDHGLRRTFFALVILDIGLSLSHLEVLSQCQANTTTKTNVQKASSRTSSNHPGLSREKTPSSNPLMAG
jgi:hypothetical protein